MTENQKLREALQAISDIDDSTNHAVDASAALDRIGQIARQALALPTAEDQAVYDGIAARYFADVAKTAEFPTPSLVPMLKGSVICGDFHKALVSAVNVGIAEFCRINGIGQPAQDVGLTDEQKTWAVNQLMEQAQVFASAWSLVGGRHDFGNALEEAEQAKTELRSMVVEALRAKGGK